MINHPVFFARNVKDYLRLEQVLVQADNNPLATLQGGLTGGDWNPGRDAFCQVSRFGRAR